MRNSMNSSTVKNNRWITMGAMLFVALFLSSLFIGKFPLSLQKMLEGDVFQWKVFWTLRFSRVLVGAVGGFTLGVVGFIFQSVFRNPLAAPDIIGVSSGASAGAAFGIIFLTGTTAVTLCSFGGALISVILAILFSSMDRTGRKSTVILAGVAVHSLAQTFLMMLKTMADPERQLASIEYWIMGSLNGINSHAIMGNLILCVICLGLLFLLHRQALLLSLEEGEAKMLGVSVSRLRLIVLVVSTLAVATIVSLSGLISFVGLLAPHSARRLTGDSSVKTMFLGGIFGAIILLLADIFARSIAQTELPVSIFTSIIGAPFLIFLIVRKGENA